MKTVSILAASLLALSLSAQEPSKPATPVAPANTTRSVEAPELQTLRIMDAFHQWQVEQSQLASFQAEVDKQKQLTLEAIAAARKELKLPDSYQWDFSAKKFVVPSPAATTPTEKK